MQEFNRTKRSQQPCSLLIFDIDHFKKVNDTFGHQAGDEVIRNIAGVLTDSIRATDIAGRYGGEEFVVLLIDADASGAKIFAERLRKRIELITVRHEQHEINYTISLGIADMDETIRDHKHWLERADNALYQAKESGRNRSIIFSKELDASPAEEESTK